MLLGFLDTVCNHTPWVHVLNTSSFQRNLADQQHYFLIYSSQTGLPNPFCNHILLHRYNLMATWTGWKCPGGGEVLWGCSGGIDGESLRRPHWVYSRAWCEEGGVAEWGFQRCPQTHCPASQCCLGLLSSILVTRCRSCTDFKKKASMDCSNH